MRKVPKLRFKEFSDEWEEKKLGEISEIIMGQSPDSKNYNEKNIGLPLIQGNADCKNRKVYPRLYTSEITKESIPNDIIMTVRAPVGAIAFSNIHSCIGRGVCAIRNTNNFIYHYLIKLENSWEKISQGSTFTAVNSNDIKKLQLILPNIQEHEKIANFLSSVDKKISLTEEKLELFREYKKGVMQKIFSQELRFKDSNGNDYPEWEEKKLGEIAFFSKGKLISKEDITEEGVECIRYGELYTIYKEKIEKVVSKTKLEKNKLILSEKNDVIIPSSGETAIDIAVASCVMKDGVALGADLNIIKTKENGLYLAYFINNPAKLELASLAQGASVIHLYEKHLKLLNIKIPTLEEQEKIADFLSSIDSKIESIEKELEGLKEFKKGLLQQMFI